MLFLFIDSIVGAELIIGTEDKINVDIGPKPPVPLSVLVALILYWISAVPVYSLWVYCKVLRSVEAKRVHPDSGSVILLDQMSYPVITESPSSIGGVQLKATEVEVDEMRIGALGDPGVSAE